MEPKRFLRSSTDKKVAGVAGGLAEYFLIDPILVRLLFIILALAGAGVGILAYIILWIITPEKPIDLFSNQNQTNMHNQPPSEEHHQEPKQQPVGSPDFPRNPNRGNLIGALVLITLGLLFLADEFMPHVNFGDLWPILLIVIGFGLLLKSFGRRQS